MAALFDSLMQDRPIGSFCFWKIPEDDRATGAFYRFLKEYKPNLKDEPPSYKKIPPSKLKKSKELLAVLDGQQRLTTLNIALRGFYAPRKYKGTKNRSGKYDEDDFPHRKFYLNLSGYANQGKKEGEMTPDKFDFQFLTGDEARKKDGRWFLVSEIWNLKDKKALDSHIRDELGSHGNSREFLYKLYEIIHKEPLINYFQTDEQELKQVCDIFVRINTGGVNLSGGQVLLSIVTAQWRGNAKEKIKTLIKELNETGRGFKLYEDFVLRACLMLTKGGIALNRDNLTPSRARAIEKAWGQITETLKTTVRLVSDFGYSHKYLTVRNTLIIIARYLFERFGSEENYKQSLESYREERKFREDRDAICDWMAKTMLRGGNPFLRMTQIADRIKTTIQEHVQKLPLKFPAQEINKEMGKSGRGTTFGPAHLDTCLNLTNGRRAFSVLRLLYPDVDLSEGSFEIDHLYPGAKVTKEGFESFKKYPSKDIESALSRKKKISNLQFLSDAVSRRVVKTKI